MKPETREWILKADRDRETALREASVIFDPNHDATCFHCQQSAEKYLKALLVELGGPYLRTHDLTILLEKLLSWYPELEDIRPNLARLTDFAVGYPLPRNVC